MSKDIRCDVCGERTDRTLPNPSAGHYDGRWAYERMRIRLPRAWRITLKLGRGTLKLGRVPPWHLPKEIDVCATCWYSFEEFVNSRTEMEEVGIDE